MTSVLVGILKFPLFVLACLLWLVIGLPFIALHARWWSRGRQGQSKELIEDAAGGWVRGFANLWDAFYGPGIPKDE